MENILTFALIGAGRFGRKLATVLHTLPDVTITLIYDCAIDTARQLANEFKASPVSRVEEIWEDESIDAVIIASPNATHLDMVCSAARAQKHIFCEKPMAFTVADCNSMIETAKEHNVKFMIGHVLRLYAVP